MNQIVFLRNAFVVILVSCGGILVHGRWPPCAVLWSHVCGLECSELSGETERGDATRGGGV